MLVEDAFILGDAREVVQQLPAGSVHCVLTDPPYGIGYLSQRTPYPRQRARRLWGDAPELALTLLDEVLTALRPRVHPDAHVYVFTHWKVFADARAVVARHFRPRSVLVWAKDMNSMGDLRFWAPRHELVLFATNGDRPLSGPRPPDVLPFRHIPRHEMIHPAQKPVPLLRYLIERSTHPGELVCDPFAGVASTLVAARACGRRYFGVEVDPDWYKMGADRLQEEVPDPCTSSTPDDLLDITSATPPDIPSTDILTFNLVSSACLRAGSVGR